MNGSFKSETFIGIIISILFSLGLFFLFLWATSPEQWNAGEHIKGCDGSETCDCYEKLIESER